jgi:predicted nucleotidyltransferase
MRAESDVDIVVEFEPGVRVSLIKSCISPDKKTARPGVDSETG